MTRAYRSRRYTNTKTSNKKGSISRRAPMPLVQPTPMATSRIFRGFYSTMRQFFPTLNEQSFSRVFAQFIITTDFSEFLDKVPELKGMPSKPEMNRVMVKMANQIATNVKIGNVNGMKIYNATRRQKGRRSTPRIIAGGEMGDNLLLSGYAMLQICLATYTYLHLPRRYAFFFVALVLYYFFVQFEVMFGMRNADYQDLILPNIAVSTIEAGTVTTHVITSIFGWLKRLLRSRGHSAVTDYLHPSHNRELAIGQLSYNLPPPPLRMSQQQQQQRAVSPHPHPPRSRSLHLLSPEELAELANTPQTNSELPYRRT